MDEDDDNDLYSRVRKSSRNEEENTLRFSSDQSNAITDSLFIGSIYVGSNKVGGEKN